MAMMYCKGCNRKAECKAKNKCLGPKKVVKKAYGGAVKKGRK